jgi:hypothetical protein
MERDGDTPVSGLYVRAIPVNHTVETMAYLIEDENCSVLISGTRADGRNVGSGPNAKNLRAVFVETSLSRRDGEERPHSRAT